MFDKKSILANLMSQNQEKKANADRLGLNLNEFL